MYDQTHAALHPSTTLDEKVAMRMLQHLHSMVLNLTDLQAVSEMHKDPQTSGLLTNLKQRLHVNVATDKAQALPAMSEAQASAVGAMARAVKVAHEAAKVDQLSTYLDAGKRNKQARPCSVCNECAAPAQ